MNPNLLRVLIVEDSADDAEILLYELERAGYAVEYERVETDAGMRAALGRQAWDIVLSDYSMPRFSGAAALRILQELGHDIPFIIVSGAIGEERAVEVMRAGAHDYVMKDNLPRLVPAIQRELREARERQARRQAEEQVGTLSRAMEQSASLVMITDLEGVIEYVNPAFTRVTGYTPDEMIGAHSRMLKSGLTPPDTYAQLWKTILSGETWRGELQNRKKNGDLYWSETTISAIKNQAGETIQFMAVQEDVTERRQAQQALRRSEALLRALLDTTTDVAFLMSLDGTFLTLNKTFAESLGATVEELVGRNGFELLNPELRADRYRQFEQVLQARQPLRWEDTGVDGWWDNMVYPVLSPSGSVEAFAVYSRNITEYKYLEAELRRYSTQLEQMVESRTIELRRAKEHIELILNNTSDALALTKPNGDIETVNPAFMTTFDERVSHSIENILWLLATEEQVAVVSDALLNVIYNSERKRVEAQVQVHGVQEKDIDLVLTPVRLDSDDHRSGVLISARDITHLKEIERFKARFIADVVHDLATPISGLMTRLYLLKRSPERLVEHIRALENQVEHLRHLLEDLRTLSQLDRRQMLLEFQPVNLNDLVQRVFDTYEPVAVSKQQTLRFSADPALPVVELDPRQCERVMVNLVSNAVNYTPEGGKIHIKTSLAEDYIVVTVADEGMGISPEDLPHVFERFYRTAQARQAQVGGTGLGLAIVKEIVELHGGTVMVSSEVNRGSTFTIRLPGKL